MINLHIYILLVYEITHPSIKVLISPGIHFLYHFHVYQHSGADIIFFHFLYQVHVYTYSGADIKFNHFLYQFHVYTHSWADIKFNHFLYQFHEYTHTQCDRYQIYSFLILLPCIYTLGQISNL